jgi:hypothetical protein
VKKNMRDDSETEDFEVGYRKPPKSGQFKKGVSGNPAGRPKKASDFGSQLMRELNSPVAINENGKRTVIRKFEGIAKQLVNKSLAGHLPSSRLVLAQYQQELEKEAEQQRLANRPVSELTDEELLALAHSGRTSRNIENPPQMAQMADSQVICCNGRSETSR